MVLRLSTCLLVVLALGFPAAGQAQSGAVVGPGRVVLPTTATAPEPNVDAGGASAAVALPDGGAILVGGDRGRGIVLARVTATGAPDPAFGSAGIARVLLPGGGFSVLQVLRRPDGRLLVAGTPVGAATARALPALQVVGLTPQGFLDAGYGDGGIGRTGLQGSCGGCEPVALQPDGGVVAGGQRGPAGAATGLVTRLDAAGRVDVGFGTQGVATIPGADGGVYGTAVTALGRIVVLAGGRAGGKLVAALDPSGAPDGGFAAGRPQTVADPAAFTMLVHDDGDVDVLGQSSIARFTAAGQPERSFGAGGVVALPGGGAFVPQSRMLAGADGSTLLARPGGYEPRLTNDPSLVVRRVTRTGEVQAVASPSLDFGGGYASPGRSTRLTLGGVDQDSFVPAQVLRRADGGYLAVGGTRIIRYTGEGEGFSRGFFAVAGLTGSWAPDPSVGGPLRATGARVRLLPQRAALGARARRVRVRVKATAPGIVLLRVRDGADRVLAQVVAPLYSTASTVVRVPLTPDGRRLLGRGRRTAVTVGHEFRDVVGARSAGVTSGALR